MSTVNNAIPFVPEDTIDPAAGLNISINTVDALLQVLVVSVGLNTPPGSPTNGARYIVGTSPAGAWTGQANKLARWLDGAWQFFDARYALNYDDGMFYVRAASTWASAPLPANVQALAGLTGAADKGIHFTGAGAMALHDQTAQARTFMAASTQAAQRTALALGSAATRAALGSTGELYGRDSVVGTVSQSAGVPTGALIEYGSNASGEYWRYAGGMQVTRRTVDFGSLVNTTAFHALYWNGSIQDAQAFAAAFIAAPAVSYTGLNGNGTAVAIPIGAASTTTSSSIVCASLDSATLSYSVDIVAIGRWHS